MTGTEKVCVGNTNSEKEIEGNKTKLLTEREARRDSENVRGLHTENTQGENSWFYCGHVQLVLIYEVSDALPTDRGKFPMIKHE